MTERDRLAKRLDELKEAILDGYDACNTEESALADRDAIRAVSRSRILTRWIAFLASKTCREDVA